MSVLLWLLPIAQASPTHLSKTLELDSDVQSFAQTSPDGFVAFLDSAGLIQVLDSRSWSLTSVSPSCSVKDVALFQDESDALSIYGACSDGSLVIFSLEEDGSISGSTVEELPVLDEEDGLVGLVASAETLWAASDDDVGVGLHDYTPSTDTVHDLGPFTTGLSGFKKLAVQGDSLIIVHGNDDLTKVDMNTGAAVRNEENLSGRSFADAASDGDKLLYLMDSGGAVVRFITSSNEYQVVLNESDDLERCSAIALQSEGESTYIALAESSSDEIRIYSLDTSTYIVSDVPDAQFAADSVEALFATSDALFAGRGGVGLEIFTAGPWVEFSSSPSGVYGEGDSLELAFLADADVDWELRLESKDGALLSSGTAAEGLESTVNLSITASFVEGDNRVYVIAEEGSNSGHDSVLVTVNNPPSLVELDEQSAGFGDGEIVLSFEGIEDADLARYDVYYSTSAFDADTYASGGPETVVSVSAEPGESVQVQIPDLTNGVTYYVGVRAMDDSEQEGPMSTVLSVTPEPAVGAAQLADEAGGCTGFNSTGRNPVAWTVLPLMLCLLYRRGKTPCSSQA